jgi:hypothetical protein
VFFGLFEIEEILASSFLDERLGEIVRLFEGKLHHRISEIQDISLLRDRGRILHEVTS